MVNQSMTLDDGNANINVRRLMCERTLTVEIKSEKFSTLIFSRFFSYICSSLSRWLCRSLNGFTAGKEPGGESRLF